MGGYDLYGQYYSSMRDAENAEMAQCAAIDASITAKEVQRLENELYRSQYDDRQLWEYVHMLEERIKILESKLPNP